MNDNKNVEKSRQRRSRRFADLQETVVQDSSGVRHEYRLILHSPPPSPMLQNSRVESPGDLYHVMAAAIAASPLLRRGRFSKSILMPDPIFSTKAPQNPLAPFSFLAETFKRQRSPTRPNSATACPDPEKNEPVRAFSPDALPHIRQHCSQIDPARGSLILSG